MRRKRTILLGAIALTAVCLTVAFSYAMGGDMPLGDVNGDGWVTAADAAVILRAAGGGGASSRTGAWSMVVTPSSADRGMSLAIEGLSTTGVSCGSASAGSAQFGGISSRGPASAWAATASG